MTVIFGQFARPAGQDHPIKPLSMPRATPKLLVDSSDKNGTSEGTHEKMENLQETKVRREEKKPLTFQGEILDVTSAATFLGISQKSLRARVARRMIPFKRWGGRVCFLRGELLDFLRSLDGCRVDEALQNGRERSSDPEQDRLQTT
jgi:hypothetical protein